MNDNIFRILAVLIFMGGAAISSYYRRKADRQAGKVSLEEEGPLIAVSLRIFGLALWLGVFAWLLNPAWMAWARIDLPDWARWLGVSMGFLANLLAYWVFSNLGNNVSPTVATRPTQTLVTSGPYRWVRHPLYTMGLIAYWGFALLAENWFIALMAVLVFAMLLIRTPHEEARLLGKFGPAYRDYMVSTGRFFPKLSR